MKSILSGNEAIARGFYEAGGRLASSYPGTPSTELLESLRRYEGIYAEWSVNEKVALETAFGGCMAGLRSMASMKHVGLNVAADALLNISYTGVNAGLVVMVADDPGMHSSQNEQDSRHYAKLAKLPCIEPSDSHEALEYTKLALELSEKFDTPVMLRTTTRISHSKGIVNTNEPVIPAGRSLHRDFDKNVLLPGPARKRHEVIEKRLLKIMAWAEKSGINTVFEGKSGLGIISSGAAYQYAREAFPDASFLRLGMTYPLPERLIAKFAGGLKKLAVVEELDPFIEGQIRGMGIMVHYGKDVMPTCGEYSKEVIFTGISNIPVPEASRLDLPLRQPTLCPGCAHRGLFVVLSRLRVFVFGDIGCYTLGALKPYHSIHCVICMGASISGAHGISIAQRIKAAALPDAAAKPGVKPVAVIGDSTFLHAGISGLMNLVYNNGDVLVVIMDNSTTGMTGGQDHPGSGKTALGAKSNRVDIATLCRALGVGRVREIDTNDLHTLEKIIREELHAEGSSVLISNRPCVLHEKPSRPPLRIDPELCDGCHACLKAGCIALSLSGPDGTVRVDEVFCTGCGVCMQLCGRDAFERTSL